MSEKSFKRLIGIVFHLPNILEGRILGETENSKLDSKGIMKKYEILPPPFPSTPGPHLSAFNDTLIIIISYNAWAQTTRQIQFYQYSIKEREYVYDSNIFWSIILKQGTITKAYLYNFDLKPHFYIVKLGFTRVYIIFLISAQNIDCGYSFEPPRRGGSNEYPQSLFWEETWKNIRLFYLKIFLFSCEKINVFE